MKKSKLTASICACLLGGISLFGDIPHTEAAVHLNSKAESVVPESDTESATSFTERVQRILNQMHAIGTEKRTYREEKKKSDEPPPYKSDQPNSLGDFKASDEIIIDAGSDEGSANELYTFDWQNTPVAQSLYTISRCSGRKIIINGDLKGTVYTKLSDVTYQQALDYLSNVFNFNWMVKDDAILISTSDLMMQSETFHLDYADKDLIKGECVALGIDEKYVFVNTEYGTVSVTGTPYQLQQVRRKISSLDRPVMQCLIIAQLIQINHGTDLNLGMQYTLPTYSHEGTTGSSAEGYGKFINGLTFSMSAKANREVSKGKVVARPMVLTKNGQKASINMGDSVPVLTSTATTAATSITVEYKDVGTKLEVTPTILKNGKVNMVVDIEMSNINKWLSQGSVQAPQITTRKANSIAQIMSGQSLVIGGLMTSSDIDNLAGIPGLMNLPILGNLFKIHKHERSYSEIYIMLTPYVVTDGIDPELLIKKDRPNKEIEADYYGKK